MKRFLTLLTIIAAILVTTAVTMAFSPKKALKPSEYKLGTTYETAMKDKKPFILIFYSDNCSYCVQSMPKYLIIDDAYKNKYNIVMMDADNPDETTLKIGRELALNSLPTMYIIDPTIDNRVHINSGLYENLRKIRVELDRYLRIRAMIKQ